MNKKIIIGIVAVILIAIVGVGGYFLLGNNDRTKENENTPPNTPVVNEPTEDENTQNDDIDNDNTTTSSKGKTLVVYYSASGSTKKVADQIAKNLNADLFKIEPVDVYTSADLDWTDNNSRVTKEHNDESLRNIKLKNTKVENWDNYDTVLIGYPIWWGIAAWPGDTLVMILTVKQSFHSVPLLQVV